MERNSYACVAVGDIICVRCRLIICTCMCCTGVFVMVTMAVSTVSVIESVIVIRLCSPQLTVKPLPPVVRLIAFRLGRLFCVSCPSTKLNTGSSRVRPTVTVDDSHSSPDVQRDTTADGTGKPTRPRTSLDDVLFELRKVNSLLVHRPRRYKYYSQRIA